MNIIKKVKEFNEGGFPFYRLAWGVMLIDILVWGTNLMLFITWPVGMFLGHVGLYPFCSGLSFLLLKISAIKDSVLLIVLSFLPFVLKMICAIGIASKKRKFCFVCVALYLLDYISLLIYFVIGEIHYQDLVTAELLKLVFTTLWGAVGSAMFIPVYYYFYPGKLPKTEKIKIAKFTYPYVAVLLVIGISVLAGVYIKENRQTATDEEIELVNRCYEYTVKYLQNELPDDKETLETMQKDIEDVIETNVFKNAFNESKFHERHMNAKVDKDYVYKGAVPEKSNYANELMYLKGKILLKLDKNDEYIDYYIDTHKYFTTSFSEKYYFEYLNNDKGNYSEDDCEVIRKGCIKLLESDLPDYEKWECTADYSVINPKNTTKEKRVEERDKLRAEYVAGYTTEKFSKDLDKYETIRRSLYMMK